MSMTALQFAERLRRLARSLPEIDCSDALTECVEVVHESVDDNFSRQVGPDGIAWPARKDNEPHPLLIKTGKMLYAAGGGQGAIVDVSPQKLSMGIDPDVVEYAFKHQDGFERIPRRRYFYVHQDDRGRLRLVFATGVRPKIREILTGGSL